MANGRSGRPAKMATPGDKSTLTLRLEADTKNLIIEMAGGYGLTVSEYLETLAQRDHAGSHR